MKTKATSKTALLEAIHDISAELQGLGSIDGRKKPGIAEGNSIEQASIEEATRLRGFLRSIDTTVMRDKDRE